jgi:hypothetical protein
MLKLKKYVIMCYSLGLFLLLSRINLGTDIVFGDNDENS